jgi:hypothetical protein
MCPGLLIAPHSAERSVNSQHDLVRYCGSYGFLAVIWCVAKLSTASAKL